MQAAARRQFRNTAVPHVTEVGNDLSTRRDFCPLQEEAMCFQSWLATVACTQSSKRAWIASDRFANILEALVELWPEACGHTACSFTMVRPQDQLQSAEVSCVQVLVYPRTMLFRIPTIVLIEDQTDEDSGIMFHRFACLLSSGEPLPQLQRFCLSIIGRRCVQQEYLLGFDGRSPQFGSVIRLGSATLTLMWTPEQSQSGPSLLQNDAEDISVLMQVEHPVEDAMAGYVRRIAGRLHLQRVVVWFHPMAQLGFLSRTSREITISSALTTGQQIRAVWADAMDTDPCYLYPVKPAPVVAEGRQPHVIVTMMQDEQFFPMLVDYLSDTERFRATFVFAFNGFPLVDDFFRQAIPAHACGWLHECSLTVFDPDGTVVYLWGQRVPVLEGLSITLREDDNPSTSEVTTCDGSSSAGSEAEESNSVDGSNETEGDGDFQTEENTLLQVRDSADPADKVHSTTCWEAANNSYGSTSLGDNTATPAKWDVLSRCATNDTESMQSSGLLPFMTPAEPDDVVSYMQGLAQTRRVQSFAVACERGRPLLQVFQLSRRIFAPVWMEQGRDLAYEQYRLRESGMWEKKVMGWYFLDYSQHFGTPFVVHLRRTGLWSAQLISLFEDLGQLEMFFLTVFPQPAMLVVADNARTILDSVVLALAPEVYSSDMLPLVVEHRLNGPPEMGALRCPIACMPITICVLLGFEARCQEPFHVRVAFRLEETVRVFVDYDRIGLPAGAHVHLSIFEGPDTLVCDVPDQRPLREHQTLIVPSDVDTGRQDEQSLLAHDGTGRAGDIEVEPDTVFMMQLAWQQAFDSEEADFAHNVAAGNILSLFSDFPYGHNGALVQYQPVPARDVLREYVRGQLTVGSDEMLAIHTWVVKDDIAMAARSCVLQPGRSLTRAFVLQWEDLAELFPIWILQASPQPMPLTLRVRPVDLVGVTKRQRDQGDVIFLLDVLFHRQPRRLTVRHRTGETVQHMVTRAGLYRVCNEAHFCCFIRWENGEHVQTWEMRDVIDKEHGTFLQLHFLQIQLDVCNAGLSDGQSLMQMPAAPRRQKSELHSYLEQWFRDSGDAQFWLHDGPDHIVQDFPLICAFHLGFEARDQCSDLWAHFEHAVSIIPIIPPPVFLVLPRPHVLVVGGLLPYQSPLLCQVFLDGRAKNLVSVLFRKQLPPIDVQSLFDLAEPQNDCHHGARCHAVYQGRMYMQQIDIELVDGTFIKLYETTQSDDEDSTTCSLASALETNEDLSADSSANEWDGVSLHGAASPENGLTSNQASRDEGELDLFSTFQLHVQPRLQPLEENVFVETEAVRRLQEDYQRREAIRSIVGATSFTNFDFLQLELRAIHSGYGFYPPLRFYGCDCRLVDREIYLADATMIQKDTLILHLRVALQATFALSADIHIAAAKPNPTPAQQGGDEAMCLLIGTGREPQMRLAMIVATGIREDIQPVLRGLRLPVAVTTTQLLQKLHLFSFCHSETFACNLLYDEQELPRYMPWRVIDGMRIDLKVSERQDVCTEMRYSAILDSLELPDSGLSLLQHAMHLELVATGSKNIKCERHCFNQCCASWKGRVFDQRPLWPIHGLYLQCCTKQTAPTGALRPMSANACSDAISQINHTLTGDRCARKVSSCCEQALSFARSPVFGLPPPGNPDRCVVWRNFRFDCLDQWVLSGETVYVYDFPCAALRIAECLEGKLPHAEEGMTAPQKMMLPQLGGLVESLTTPIPPTCPDLQYIYDQLPPAVLHDFAELVLDPPSGLDRITLYTDGSYSQTHPDSAGWSVVVLGHKDDFCWTVNGALCR